MATFDYAPAPESRAVVDLQPSYGLFIGGEFVDGSGEPFKTVNPATEESLAEIAEATAADVDRAVAAARAAYRRVWGPMSGADRGKYLYRIARIMQERSRELAVLETLDNGKPIKESRDVDVPLAAAHFFYHAGWADKLGYAALGPDPRPLGVVGQVIPWNFPLLMLAWKIAPALACGNTVVLKPAETTPLTALLFAQICQQADLPPGVVNIVTGAGSTGQAIVDHAGIDKIAFTGSTGVGKMIARSIAGTRKRATLELGGKAANIVFDDAPLDRRSRGSSTASSSTRARSVVPEADCSSRSPSPTRSRSGSSAGWRPCASVTQWTRTPTWARSTAAGSSTGSPSSARPARPRVPRVGTPAARCRRTVSGSARPSSLG